jgi:hypothetical protein
VLSRVDLFERIRRDRRIDPGVSVRELARRHGVHRRTVREALVSAVPPERKKPARTRALVREPAMGGIDAMLREDLAAPRKQRHTMRRIYDRLVVEYGFDQACYSTVCNYVNRRRPEIEAEAREGRAHVDGATAMPSPASSALMRRYPHDCFSRASRSTTDRTLRCMAGRPDRTWRDNRPQRRRSMPRCQRTIVPGVTINRIAARRSAGTAPASSASHARSDHVRRE